MTERTPSQVNRVARANIGHALNRPWPTTFRRFLLGSTAVYTTGHYREIAKVSAVRWGMVFLRLFGEAAAKLPNGDWDPAVKQHGALAQ